MSRTPKEILESGLEDDEKKKGSFFSSWTFVLVVCVLLPILFRSFVYAPRYIPSGSMKPTLLIGDFIFVSKFSYGYGKYTFPVLLSFMEGRAFGQEPEIGDVVVFRPPSNPKLDYIKRLIAHEGDRVQVLEGEVYINGKRLRRKRIEDFIERAEGGGVKRIPQYMEVLPNGVAYHVLDERQGARLDNTQEFTVPAGHYFFMGDNRDNSEDSRGAIGFVPQENLIGRADMVFASSSSSIWRFWQWFSTMRNERFFLPVQQLPRQNPQK